MGQPVDLDCENEPYTLVAGRVVLTNYPRTAASDPQNTCIVDGLPKTASLKSLTYDAAGSKVVMKVENESPIGVIDLLWNASSTRRIRTGCPYFSALLGVHYSERT